MIDFTSMSNAEILELCKPSRKPIGKVSKKKAVPSKGKTGWGRRYPDQREVCDDKTAAGQKEYKRRTYAMADRQNWRCGYCGEGMFHDQGYRYSVTFEHVNLRGMGGAIRDDRIEIDGKPYNLAVCYKCNGERGSKRQQCEKYQ